MKKITGCLAALAFVLSSKAQTTTSYVIRFKDKGNSPYTLSNPAAYLTQRAIDRRTRYSIPIDSTDLPVTPKYLDSLRLAGAVTLLNASRWLNAVSIQTNDAAALAKINAFPFVKSVTGIAPRIAQPGAGRSKWSSGIQSLHPEMANELLPPDKKNFELTGLTADFYDYGLSYNQVHIHNGEFLHNIGLRGQTMVIGMLDAGFQNYLTVKAFDSIRTNGQILGVYDFVVKDSSVNEDNSHGMQCFSTIGANIPGQFVGTAPKASFYLFRSENAATEYPIEEHNWVCAAERVDSLGGDLISSSLGYNTFDPPFQNFDHTYADLNGNTTVAAIGADLAAKKGILVVNSAGNEGDKTWHYLITPADGDSVLAVAAVITSGTVAAFSSFGPSSGGQVKPDVASVGQGTVVQNPGNFISTNNGTSFSAPNMAGLVTCLWQGFREFNNMKIINALRQSGSMAAAPDERLGYGIPDVKKAVMALLKDFSTATVAASNCKAVISFSSKDMSAMKYEVERRLAGQASFSTVGEISGMGSSFSTHQYQFEDVLTGVLAGNHSYRIRQIIDTARASLLADYIDTVTLNLATNCTATGVNPVNPNDNQVVLLPNPAHDEFAVKVTTPAPIQNLWIRMFNSKGQEVYQSRFSKGSGTTVFTITSSHLAKGKYYVSVYNDGQLMSTKELVKL